MYFDSRFTKGVLTPEDDISAHISICLVIVEDQQSVSQMTALKIELPALAP